MSDQPAQTLPPWYIAWAVNHCQAFALRGDAPKTVLAWGPVFTVLFTPDDLQAATAALVASRGDLQWVADHRRAIIDEVTHARSRARQQRADDAIRCEMCDGTGWATVPHPGSRPGGGLLPVLRMPAADPAGLTRTLAVTCCCPAGERTYAGEEGRERPPLTLTAYETRYPNFREVQFARESLLRAAQSSAEPSDADYQTVRALLARRAAMPSRSAG